MNQHFKFIKAIALLILDRLLAQEVPNLLIAAVMMALIGTAAPYIFGGLAVAMPWLCRAAMLLYLGLAAFKAGWQVVNRFRAVR